MQKYDWPRLFAEVRPTFLPYARFKMQTHLSPEQCREKLASVTQPQKMPAFLVSKSVFLDARHVFKGQISKTRFFVEEPQPFWLIGRIKPAFSGTSVTVNVFLDPWCYLVSFGLLSIVLAQTVEIELVHGLYSYPGKLFFVLLFLLRSLAVYLAISLPASFKAFQMKRMLKRLLQVG